MPLPTVILVRHGETEWSRSGRHTGRTDVELTELGREQGAALAGHVRAGRAARVLTSPLRRAAETCRLAGLGADAEPCPDLVEWDYGRYEGLTTAEIRKQVPGWSLWRDAVPDGETADDVGRRADRVIAALRLDGRDAVLFSHGHILRVLAARWIALSAVDGRHLALDTATVSVLGWEREVPVISRWNDDSHLLSLMPAD